MKRITIPMHTKRLINKRLSMQFGKEEAKKKWKKIQTIYERYMEETPDIGGKDNMMWEQLYNSLAIFAYYEVMEGKVSLSEIEDLTVEIFMGSNRVMGHFLNFNWKWSQKLNYTVYKSYKRKLDSHIQDGSWNNTWGVSINPENKKQGVCIHLIGCPVADFAKQHGYEDILPALCASDHRVFAPLHCKLIRYHTVANGDKYCEFWQVGDKSEAWKNAVKEQLL